MARSGMPAAVASIAGLGGGLMASAMPQAWPDAPIWMWYVMFWLGAAMFMAFPTWVLSRVARVALERYRTASANWTAAKQSFPSWGMGVVAAIMVGLLILAIAYMSGSMTMEAQRDKYAPFDRAGVPFEQGWQECEYQAELATAAIRRFEDRLVPRERLRRRCLQVRGY